LIFETKKHVKMIRSLSIWKNERQKFFLPAQLQRNGWKFPSLGGVAKI